MPYPNLFSPIKIGTRTVKNRIIFPCHSYESLTFPEYIAYEEARAKGGCGLNIIGPCVVHHSGETGGEHLHEKLTPEMIGAQWKQMADTLHKYGTLVLIQLWHVGDKSEGLAKTSWGVSENPVNNDLGRAEVPHEMTDAEINEIIDGFATYAKAAKDAGLDGCEIHGSHGYLPQQFWSPWVNHRKDKWKEPLRFITEVVSRIRQVAGKDFIIGIRMSGDDLYPGQDGIDAGKSQQLARDLEATGFVDFLNISVGHGGNSNAYTIAAMNIPPASISVPMASGIKQAVRSIPVIAVGRINDPAIAEKAIADGHCDLVGLVRGQIADPEFANKSREGKIEEIRLCIACNQGCNVGGKPLCTQNMISGRETKDIAVIKPAPKKKKVIVIGGGPAGMEAARVAARRGHDVTLYEKGPQLGGLLNTVIKAPGREEFSQITRYLSHQLANLKVKIVFNTEVTPEMVKRENPDTVIVAVGARPYVEPVPGSGKIPVVSPSQILNGELDPGKKVLLYECTGEQEAPNTAEYLGEKGIQVEMVTSQISLFAGLMMPAGLIASRYLLLWPRLRKNGINLTTHAKIKEIAGKNVILTDVWSGEERTIENVDTVVMSTGYLPNNALYKKLQGQVKELYTVGDCVTPKRALNAIHDAYMMAFSV